MTGEPKPPPPTGWIRMVEVRDAPPAGAIAGVAIAALALIGVLLAIVAG